MPSDTLRTYVVVLKDTVVDPGAVAKEHAVTYGAGVKFVYRAALKGYAATLPSAAVKAMSADARIDFIEADQEFRAVGQTTPTGIQRIFAPNNPNIGINAVDDKRVDVDIAIIDTGIDYHHPELNVVARTDCTGGNAHHSSCVDGSGIDGAGHGTHVAGTAAAIDNGNGVVGVAPGARLWAVKVLDDNGFGQTSWVVAGIDWVTAHANDIAVANMSFGGFLTSRAEDKAITNSVAKGIVYAAAAGNSHVDAATFSPANHPDVIAVSALADFDGKPGGLAAPTCFTDVANNKDDTLAFFSNFGSTVKITAPGVCILSTWPGGGYATLSGTSMAAPHVTGAAALLASGLQKPVDRAGALAIRTKLIAAGNFNWVDNSGDGIQEPLLDVHDPSIFAPAMVSGPFNAPPFASFTETCNKLNCTFDASASSDVDGSIAKFAWDFGDRSTATGAIVSHWYSRSGSYSVTLTVTDNQGATDTYTSIVTVTSNTPPVASFTYTCTKLACSFDASGSYDPDGSIVSYAWDFGDKAKATGITSAHTYAATDLYPVTLTVTDNQRGTGAQVIYVPASNGTRAIAAPGCSTPTDTKCESWVSAYDPRPGALQVPESMAVSPAGDRVYVAGLGFSKEMQAWTVLAYNGTSGVQDWISTPFDQGGCNNGPAFGGGCVAFYSALSADGAKLYVTGYVSTKFPSYTYVMTIAYDAATGHELWRAQYDGADAAHPVTNDIPSAIALSTDGRQLYVASSSTAYEAGYNTSVAYHIVAYDAATGVPAWTSEVDDHVAYMKAGPKGDFLYTAGDVAGSLGGDNLIIETAAYNTAAGAQVWATRHELVAGGINYPRGLAVSPDGNQVYMTGTSSTQPGYVLEALVMQTIAYNAATGSKQWEQTVRSPVPGPATARDIVASPDGKSVYITGLVTPDGVQFWYDTVAYAAADGAQRWSQLYGLKGYSSNSFAIKVSPDSTRVYVTGGSGDMRVQLGPYTTNGWDYATLAYDASGGSQIWAARYNSDAQGKDFNIPYLMGLSADGKRLFVSGYFAEVDPTFGDYSWGTAAYDTK